ncbi:MAG: hypothetical protein DCC73_04955 [Proteobacteria bacterium]|nr:MAG: hypothetical protein DCC73_04955 [Pseudomonadota bacterium]
MSFTIDIDTGGTFTDGFLNRNGEVRTVKVPTTPHDLTVCFAECIKAGAKAFDISEQDLLYDTEIIRFSNTIGTNTIIQRDGTRIGLLLSKGLADLAPTEATATQRPLVQPNMVLEIDEATDGNGEIKTRPQPADVLRAAQQLIDTGARCLVVAFENSEMNPANEREVRRIIKAEYPRDYLGSIPVFLASDITPRSGVEARINTAVLNAYVHAKLTRLLYKAGENLRQRQYRRTLFIGHNNGTVARVAKTRAFQTYNSGPAAGLLGVQWLGKLYGKKRLISTDMGGTSFDIGWIREGEPSYALEPEVEGFACNLPMLEIAAFGAGGGSIAALLDGELRVGPQSAGALPGPVCFGLGGAEPTVTDANLTLGLLDANFFLGGSMRLDVEKARAAIADKIAKPLGITVEEAALAIRAEIDRAMGKEVAVVAQGFGEGEEPVIVAYGGAGGLHACAIAEEAGLSSIIVTPFSAVFSAFSSSLIDVGHIYYRRLGASLSDAAVMGRIEAALSSMETEARRDMRGEGIDFARATTHVHLLVRDKDKKQQILIPVTVADFRKDGMAAVVARAAKAMGMKAADLVLDTLGYLVQAPVSPFKPARHACAHGPADEAIKERRSVYDGGQKKAAAIPVYDRQLLLAGHELSGPAIVESDQTTFFVHAGWRFTIDDYNNALVQRGRLS